MQESEPDFEPILKALAAANVRFVVIGGVAMTAHGSSHVTKDIDVGFSRERSNIAAIYEALRQFQPIMRGLPPGVPLIWDETLIRNAGNLTLDTSVTPLDLLSDISGIASFENLWENSTQTILYGVKVRIASLDDLIAMKRAANRPKDQNHVLELLALKKILKESEEK